MTATASAAVEAVLRGQHGASSPRHEEEYGRTFRLHPRQVNGSGHRIRRDFFVPGWILYRAGPYFSRKSWGISP
jgi:hypothetical protein